MAGWSAQRPPWQVRIRRTPDGVPVGAGLLCTDTHVVTCAHLLTLDGAAPAGRVFADFQFLSPHKPVPAAVVAGGWHPPAGDGAGDIAVLALQGPLPVGAEPAPLRDTQELWGHPFRAYGYPRGHERYGVWSHGLIVGPAEVEWVQLQAEGGQGFALRQGFSGAPIWDDQLGAVIGIVVSTDRDLDARTGYGIPMGVVRRCWPGLDPWVGWRLSHDAAMVSHWSPRARGVERDSRPGWYFTGRRQVLRELVEWLEHQPADGRVRVVTGGPGSGKSAVLARLVALADPALRARIRHEDPGGLADPSAVPSLGRVSVAVHATGLDLAQVTGKLADAISARAADPDMLIALVRQHGRGLVVVVDGLDEAVTAGQARVIAGKLLVPLARDAADVGVKVLVGTRAGPDGMFLRALGAKAAVIDVDRDRYLDLDDLVGYAARSLRLEFDATASSPYRDDPAGAEKVARAIAEAAFPSFLVAGLTARAHAEDVQVIDTSVSGWQRRAGFPADVDMAMADYLDRLDDPQRALDLLVPVAYARYPGLPRDTLWAPLAQAYSGRSYGPGDIAWLLESAAAYLLEETDDGGAVVVRLFHQALVDHIRGRSQPSLVEHTITTVLAERAEAQGGWLRAERYARVHTASHAAQAGGGLLDRLVGDPAFLVAADRRVLLRALPCLDDPQARRVGDCYRAAAARLCGEPAADAAYLELASRAEGNDTLGDGVRRLGLPQPFITKFVRRQLSDEPLPLTGHTGWVTTVAWGSVDGAPVLASAGLDGTVRMWDPATGAQLRVLTGHNGGVWAVAWGRLEGTPVVASAGVDATVRLWDPADGAQLRVLTGHTDGVWTVRWANVDGTPVLASASADATVRLWDPAGGAQLRVLTGHTGGVSAVAWGMLDGAPVLASAGYDATVRLWDPATGTQLRVLTGHTDGVWTVAWGMLEGTPVLASAGLDGTVRLWDPATGTQLRVLTGHTGGVFAVAWGNLDSTPVLASAGFEATVRLWDPAGGAQLRALTGHTSEVWAVAWGRLGSLDDGSMLASASADATVRLWDPTDGTQLRVLTGHTGGVLAVAWGMLDGTPVLASAGFDATVRLWDPANGAQLRALTGHTGGVWAVAWRNLDGPPVLASAGFDATVRLWGPATGAQLRVLTGHTGWVRAVAWGSLDGRPVLTSAGLDATVRLWNPVDGIQLRVLTGHPGGVLAVAWGSLDGEPVLASAGFDGTVRLWDPATGAQLRVLTGHTAPVLAVAWGMLDGGPVLASASADATVRLWDSRRLREAVIRFENPLLGVSISPQGWLGIVGSGGLAVLATRTEAFANSQTAQQPSFAAAHEHDDK